MCGAAAIQWARRPRKKAPLSHRQLDRCSRGSFRSWNKAPPSPISWAQDTFKSINKAGDTTMFTNTKITLAAAFILGAVSSGLAGNIETNSREAQGAITCPALEGYPDCHPDDRASPSVYSTHSRRPVSDRSRH
jgi:hypothetical protein